MRALKFTLMLGVVVGLCDPVGALAQGAAAQGAAATKPATLPDALPGTLEEATNKLAKKVHDYLKEREDLLVRVDRFEGPTRFPNNDGLAIRQALETKLKTLGVKVDVGGRTLKGTYKLSTDGAATTVFVRAKMITRNDEEDLAFVEKFQSDTKAVDPQAAATGAVSEKVSSKADVSQLVGNNVDLTSPPAAGGAPASNAQALAAENAKFAQSVNNPTVAIQPSKAQPAGANPLGAGAPPAVGAGGPSGAPPVNSVVSATTASPYRIELLVRNPQTKTFEPRPAVARGGLAFASIGFGDEYAVRIINDADHDVGVKICIDSLSMFEFSEIIPYRQLQMVWIGAHSSGVVTGWHINNQVSRSFQIVELPKAAAVVKQVQSGDIGTISALFFPSWTGPIPPAVELRGAGRAGNDLIGTGVGQAIQQKYGEKVAQFGKTLLASVTIRYEIPLDLPPDGPPAKP